MIFEFGLPCIIAFSQRHFTIRHSFRSFPRFLQDSFVLSTVKNMTCNTPQNCLFSNLPYSRRFQIRRNTAYRGSLCTSSKDISCFNFEAKGRHIFPLFPPFCSKRSKHCAHDKNSKRTELWVKINLLNVFVMHTWKVRRLNRSRSVVELTDWLCRT